MKILVAMLAEAADISKLPKGTAIKVTDGTNELADGVVMVAFDMFTPTEGEEYAITGVVKATPVPPTPPPTP